MDKPYTEEQVKQWLEEERELEESIERGEWKAVEGEELEEITKKVVAAAKNYVEKKRINIRLPQHDLTRLKERAERLGLPYQTMIAGILHQVATGQWDEKMGS